MPHNHSKNPESVASFRERVAKVFIRLSEGYRATEDVTSMLQGAGLTGLMVKATGTEERFTAEIAADEAEGLPRGTKRDDFTAEKLAEIDAKIMHAARYNAWYALRNRILYGDSTIGWRASDAQRDQCLDAMRELGFTEAELPQVKTAVSAYVQTGETDRDGDVIKQYVGFTVAGEITKEQVTERLLPLSGPDPWLAKVRDKFPEAEGLEDNRVTSVSVHKDMTWPEFPPFVSPSAS